MKKKLYIGLIIVVGLAVLATVKLYSNSPLTMESSKSPANSSEENFIEATLHVNDLAYTSRISAGKNVFDLMSQIAQEERTPKLTFNYKEYTGMGPLINEINGVPNDQTKNLYWIFYVNGNPSTVGVSNYIVQNKDVITWKYEIPKS